MLLSGLYKIRMHTVLFLKVHISAIFISGFEELLSQGPEEVKFVFSVSLVEMCLFCGFVVF